MSTSVGEARQHDYRHANDERERIRVSVEPQWHVRTGTTSRNMRTAMGDSAVERGMPPKPIRAMWMRLYMQHVEKVRGNSIAERLACGFHEAS
jgi:hypothetical protein